MTYKASDLDALEHGAERIRNEFTELIGSMLASNEDRAGGAVMTMSVLICELLERIKEMQNQND